MNNLSRSAHPFVVSGGDEADVQELEAASLIQLAKALPEAVLLLDRDWRIVFANSEARRISRLSAEHLNRETHWELFPETVGTPLEQTYRRVMESRAAETIQYFHAPFDLWINVHVVPVGIGLALYYRDITATKHTEQLRATMELQLATVFNLAPNSVFCFNRQWRCTYFNGTAQRILHVEDLLGKDLWTHFPLGQEEPFATQYRTTMEQRTPTDFEAFYPEPLNRWFRVWVRPFDDGIIIFAGDTTERRRAEITRDATARQLQQVFDATTDGVVGIAPDWTITLVNRQAIQILGRYDLIGRNVWEEYPSIRNSPFEENYRRTMDLRTPTEFEAYYPEPLNRWFVVQSRPSDGGIVVFLRDVTEERSATQALLRQQETLAFVQQTARVATWEIDLGTEAIAFTEGSCEVYGKPFSEIPSLEDVRELTTPEHRRYIDDCFQWAIRTHTTTSVDYPVITEDGRRLWMESRGSAIYDEHGAATHLRGMTTDITTRKENEEKLAASEARYRVLAELSPQALWMGTPEGRIIYANQGFLDYIGKSLEGMSGMDWLQVIDPADRDKAISAWRRAMLNGSELAVEARLIRAHDKESCWWSLRALPVRDESGTILHWLGVANDIHQVKMAAEEIRRKQEETERQRVELESIYQTAPIGLALFDPVEFRYLKLNDRQAEIVGLPPEQILGRTLTEISPIKGLKELFQQVAAGKPVQGHLLEGEIPTRPGEHRFWNVNYFPVYGPDGRVRAITAASLEITHQRKSELALIQSEKLAAVGRLASSISHEINNPLEAITNLLFLVAMDTSLSDQVKTYIRMAQSELSRVSQIATQTLRFHRQAVKPTFVTAKELVDAVLNLYQGRLANSGIRVDVTYRSATQVLCFENDIRQVLNNLIANAIDAMRAGGRLMIRAQDTVDQPSGRYGIRISIADTGHGMPPHVQARIFEPFYTTKELNGTGLGLWISSGIVQHHLGRLTVRSSQHPVHHGTVFCLFLPAHEEITPAF